MNVSKFKKTTLAILLLILVVMPAISPSVAFAQEKAQSNWLVDQAKTKLVDPLRARLLSTAADFKALENDINSTVTGGAASFFGLRWLVTISTKLMALTGQLMDYAITLSIKGALGGGESIYNSPTIHKGWTVFRDLVNIVFIFLIVYIAFRTILGLSSGGLNQLLVRIIVAALLVNFSLVITGLVIDAGNAASLVFYDQFTTYDDGVASFSDPFRKAAKPERFSNTQTFNDVVDGSVGVTLGMLGTSEYWILTGGQLVVNTVMVFILAAGAILFIIRTVVLWMLMILSPLAFVAYIIPGMKGQADKWIHTLLNNVFFAPAFLALFYVSTLIYTSDEFTNLLNVSDPTTRKVMIVFSFAIVIALALASLIIARQLGARGASSLVRTGNRWAKRSGKYVGSRTGRRALSAVTATGAAAIGASERAAQRGGAAGRAAKIARTLIPFKGTMREAGRADIAQHKDKASKQSTTTLKERVRRHRFTSRAERTAIMNELAKRGELKPEKGITIGKIERARKYQEGIGSGEEVKDIRKQAWQYAKTQPKKEEAITRIDPTTGKKIVVESDAMEKIDISYFDGGAANTGVRNKMYDNLTGAHIRKLADRTSDDAAQRFFANVRADFGTNSVSTLLPTLDARNPKLAAYVRSREGDRVLKSNGFVP